MLAFILAGGAGRRIEEISLSRSRKVFAIAPFSLGVSF